MSCFPHIRFGLIAQRRVAHLLTLFAEAVFVHLRLIMEGRFTDRPTHLAKAIGNTQQLE